jgi:WD40 repeat protein
LLIVSGSADTTVRVWDIATGQEIISYDGHEDWVSEVQFTSDGNYAIAADQKNFLIMWQVPSSTDENRQWALENRYDRDVSCGEREQYRIEPLCETESEE